MSDLNVLSLGAGVQSTTVLLMSEVGELPPFDLAIFADVGWEPKATYQHLAWLEATCETPIVRVSAGSLRQQIGDLVEGRATRGSLPPFYSTNRRGYVGQFRRRCTTDLKIKPIRRYYREHAEGCAVHQWLGISYDEAQRMRDPEPPVALNVYPLVDRRMTRWDCIRWLEAHGYPVPPKSSCLGCPYHGNAQWLAMKRESPDEWAETVALDERIRHLPKWSGPVYIHKDARPLAEAVRDPEGEMSDMFEAECQGLCGV